MTATGDRPFRGRCESSAAWPSVRPIALALSPSEPSLRWRNSPSRLARQRSGRAAGSAPNRFGQPHVGANQAAKIAQAASGRVECIPGLAAGTIVGSRDRRPAMNNLAPAELGERLRGARSGANLTQDAAAAALGMSRTTLVAIEKGQRSVRPEELLAFARLYGVSAR